ncbi:hypothetical protein CPC08DRAFT_392241 [Agrocybe pediades]|nr:hypothetical protein CPC08DRAFT_392241 [Agrocybe pediades]
MLTVNCIIPLTPTCPHSKQTVTSCILYGTVWCSSATVVAASLEMRKPANVTATESGRYSPSRTVSIDRWRRSKKVISRREQDELARLSRGLLLMAKI